MNLFDVTKAFSEYTFWQQQIIFVFRLLLAVACGAAVGFERTLRFKEAGIRTHALVACSAAALMMLSKYGFTDLLSGSELLPGVAPADAARIGAAILTGIGFLCAAVIFKQGNTIHGLTTSAGIWSVAAVGMLIGTGMYIVALALTAIILIVLLTLHFLKIGQDAYIQKTLHYTIENDSKLKDTILKEVEKHSGKVGSISIKKESGGLVTIKMVVHLIKDFSYEEINELVNSNPKIKTLSIE